MQLQSRFASRSRESAGLKHLTLQSTVKSSALFYQTLRVEVILNQCKENQSIALSSRAQHALAFDSSDEWPRL